MKQKLIQELPDSLRKQVVCTVDLSCNAGPEALRHVALRAVESVASSERSPVEHVLSHFFQLTLKDSMCCWGEQETRRALEMGAVEHLLLSADADTELDVDAWKALAVSYGTHVVDVCPISEQGAKFCQHFRVGGCFRWPLEPELLGQGGVKEEDGDEDALANTPPVTFADGGKLQEMEFLPRGPDNSTCPSYDHQVPDICLPHSALHVETGAAADAENSSISTMDSLGTAETSPRHTEALQWFQAELSCILGDSSAAEAIATCVHVVLSDEVSSRDEIAEGMLAVASAEGVPEELALELMRRW